MTTRAASARSGKPSRTIAWWCEKHGIGRKIGGKLEISRVALEMFLEGDYEALSLYHAGDRESETVRRYFAAVSLHASNATRAITANDDTSEAV